MRILALDIGGTWLRADLDGSTAQVRTPDNGKDALAATLELAGDARVDAVGVSFGGRVHGDEVRSLHVPGWEDVGLVDALRAHFDAPVTIANDANAGAVGEWDAAGRPDEPVAYITVSTGVGGGVVVGGEIVVGAHGLAGEIGHLVVDPDGAPCACGQRGCVETLASGPAIARHGDYAEAARGLAVAVEALRAVVDPLFVAIGGGVATAPQLWEALRVNAQRAKSTPLHGARVLALLVLVLLLAACGGGGQKFTNPVYDQDFPDPFVLKDGGTYYAYATNVGQTQVPTLTSKDLVHWKPGPDALPRVGTWTFNGQTWAPSVLKRADGTYVMYYTAGLCIGRATARTPLGPFHDPFAKPLVCQTDAGGSIDPSPFRDPSGALYLVWKNDGNSAGQPTHIWSQRLSADGLQLVGAPKILTTDEQSWEGSIVEGPELWLHDGRYILFFSGGAYATSGYSVGYATCKGPLGPCTQAPENPILKSACHAYGPGGETLLDVGGTTWMLYHAWPTVSGGTKRVLWLDRLDWKDGKPVVHGPTCTPQNVP